MPFHSVIVARLPSSWLATPSTNSTKPTTKLLHHRNYILSQPKHHQRRRPAIEIATKYQPFSGAIRNRNCNIVCHPPVTRSALGFTYPSPHAAQSTDTVPPRSLQRNRGPGNSYACRYKIDIPRLSVKEPSPWQNFQITNTNTTNQTNTGFFGAQSSLSHVRQLTKNNTKSHAAATVVATGSTTMTTAATLLAYLFSTTEKQKQQTN